MTKPRNDEIIVSSQKRPSLTRHGEASLKVLLGLALLCSLFLMTESFLLRSGLYLSYFSVFSVPDMLWYTLILFFAAFCFSMLLPKKIQLLIICIQLLLNVLILGAILSFKELPTLGLLHFIFKQSELTEQVIKAAVSSPFCAILLLLFVLKAITLLMMPPYRAKQRLPWGALLFMACCITLVPSQSATLKVLTTTRTPSYNIMAMQSIQRHGYFFTWLAEQQSKTWWDCYIPPNH